MVLNARIEKWREMLSEADPAAILEVGAFKRRVRKGIPFEVKKLAYRMFTDQPPELREMCSDKSLHDIGLDIPRTFGNEQPTKNVLAQVNKILKGLATEFTDIGYIQGMNYWIYRLVQAVGVDLSWRVAYRLLRIPEISFCLVDLRNIDKINFVL